MWSEFASLVSKWYHINSTSVRLFLWAFLMTSSLLIIQVTLRAFFGRPGEWFEQNDLDGDKNSIFHDLDGSISSYTDTYVARADNFLIRHPQCVDVPHWNGVVCSGKYSQVKKKESHSPCAFSCHVNMQVHHCSKAVVCTISLCFWWKPQHESFYVMKNIVKKFYCEK